MLSPPISLFLVYLTFTLWEERAEVIRSARYFDLAFSAIFVRYVYSMLEVISLGEYFVC